MRHVIPTLAFAVLLGGCGAPTAEIVPAAAFETNYTVIPEESHIRFSSEQEGEPFTGEFTEFDARIFYDGDEIDVQVLIPLTSVRAGSTDRNSTLPGPAWFDVKAFPVAEFRATELSPTPTRDGKLIALGTLTMKGISADVSLPFRLTEENGRTVMEGQTSIMRTDWNVGAAPWDTDEYVRRQVDLDVRIVATTD